MICPHCKYAHGTDWHTLNDDDGRSMNSELLNIDGVHGNFYRLPVAMERYRTATNSESRATMFGCPSCSKVFIDL